MLAYPNVSTIPPNPSSILRKPVKAVLPSVNKGNVSVIAERKHLSMIVYAVPSERVQALLPDSFQAEQAVINGQTMAWVSVESFSDQSLAGQPAFEQTNYLLHVLHSGQPCQLLLGSSLGSLAAVGLRNLWPTPWHLGAMEFRVAYNKIKGQYREYTLQSQSQWVNASWQIRDTGQAIDPGTVGQTGLPASLFRSDSTVFFTRRDGSVGSRRTVRFNFEYTRGELKQAQCDLLERLGLLNVMSREELMRPAFVGLQHSAKCQLFSPTVLNDRQPLAFGHKMPTAYAS